MEKISWIKNKINEKILKIVKEKCNLMNVIKVRRWKVVGQDLRQPEDLFNSIIGRLVEENRIADWPRNFFKEQIKKVRSLHLLRTKRKGEQSLKKVTTKY